MADQAWDFEAIRKAAEAEMDPEWVARYGDEHWKAALMAIGELHEKERDDLGGPGSGR